MSDIKHIISVVIPFYSNKHWLEESINSILDQTYKNLEIIVVNDGSLEDISYLEKQYSNIVSFVHQKNKGAASARNKGIAHCTGEYVAFMDSDDLWMKNKLEIQIRSMAENKSVWSSTGYITFGNSGGNITILPGVQHGEVYDMILNASILPTPSIVIKRELLSHNPDLRFDEEMRYGEDLVLWLKLAAVYKLNSINKPLCSIRIHGNNAAKKAYAQIEARAIIYQKIKKMELKPSSRVLTKIGYKFCYWLHELNKSLKTEKFEFLNKMLYALPWMLFHFDNFLIKKERG